MQRGDDRCGLSPPLAARSILQAAAPRLPSRGFQTPPAPWPKALREAISWPHGGRTSGSPRDSRGDAPARPAPSGASRRGLDGARRALLELIGQERRLVEKGMGAKRSSGPAARLAGATAREAREGHRPPGDHGLRARLGRRLGRRADRIWINFVRLIFGRIGDLELTSRESQPKPGVHVRPAGVHVRTYVPHPHGARHALARAPFAFDWREDIDRSAARLAARSRRSVPASRFTSSPTRWVGWSRVASSSATATPGRAWTIPAAAPWRPPGDDGDAQPRFVRDPARLHGRREDGPDARQSGSRALARRDAGDIATFPGLYQMLPSPLVRPRRQPARAAVRGGLMGRAARASVAAGPGACIPP